MEGIEPLSPDKSLHKSFIIDDMPVPSPKKDFNTLLEERLKDSNTAFSSDAEKPVKKFPFLKKGQGLARFRPNPSGAINKRNRSKSVTPNRSTKHDTLKSSRNTRRSEPVKLLKNSPILKNALPRLPITQQQLAIKDITVPKAKLCSRMLGKVSSTYSLKNKNLDISSDMNSSDPEVKTKRELDEVRIFEILEEKAENSSFCSTSSAVVAFLQHSSPLKSKFFLQHMANGQYKDTNGQKQCYKELVCETKTNICHSPQVEKHINNEEQSVQWKSAPFSNTQSHVSKQKIKTCNLKTWENQLDSCLRSEKVLTEENGTQEMICSQTYETDMKPNEDESGENEEVNTSLHVRFSEYNEYKTIGLSDVSSISTDSRTDGNYSDSQAWSDYSATSDSSDVETMSSNLEMLLRKPELRSLSIQKRQHAGRLEMSDDENSSVKSSEESEVVEDAECSSKESQEEEDTLLEINYDDNDEDCSKRSPSRTEQNTHSLEEENRILFKSELLKSRLSELEREIEIFRKENAALLNQRQKLEEERIQFQKFMREKEEKFALEKKMTENNLQEEKKKLIREKTALDNRLKDAREKALQSKKEREEIKCLKEQLQELKEEVYQKESKWQAAQGRLKCQMRVLQTENTKLKEEMERLQKLRDPKIKKPNSTNTRAIHKINKTLDREKKTITKANLSFNGDDFIKTDVENKNIQCSEQNSRRSSLVSKEFTNEEENKFAIDPESIEKRRSIYKSLLHDATIGLFENQEARKKAEQQCTESRIDSHISERTSNESSGRNSFRYSDTSKSLTNTESKSVRNSLEHRVSHTNLNTSKEQTEIEVNEKGHKLNQQGIKEIQHPDGHIEILYPNGNLKKIFPDKNFTKIIYYNGDVREKYEDGKVRYYYAAMRTYHTTMPDGLEILEFPDGQVERRSKNGTVEVSFPDGTVKIVQSDGTEKWALTDGTLAETSADGDRILKLANGQREVHTKDHMRREYPDGTVKLVYKDGTQETRYANGRVRLKDKDGNLIMDSHNQ